MSGYLHQNPVVPLLQDVFVRISASAASRATCARSLYAGLLSKTSLSGSLRQDPVVGPLVQDHCIRISCARCLCRDVCTRRATCARSLYENFLCKMSVSKSSQPNPVGALVQDRCTRISCVRCLCQDLLSRTTCAKSLYADLLCISLCQDLRIRILYDHLRKISVCGSLVHLVHDLFVRTMSAAGSCRTTCARSLHQDLLQCKFSFRISAGPLVEDSLLDYTNATLPAFRAMDTHDLPRGLHFEIRNRNFTSISRWARTISAEGCTSKPKNATLPAFRANDTHDLRRGLHFETKKHNFTCISCQRHARSRQRVALRNQKTQLYLHSTHSTRTISAEGSHLETMLQKY